MGSLFTGSFGNWMRKLSPFKCCKLPVSTALRFVGKIGKKGGRIWMVSVHACANTSHH